MTSVNIIHLLLLEWTPKRAGILLEKSSTIASLIFIIVQEKVNIGCIIPVSQT